MTFREFVKALCDVTGEKVGVPAAKTLLIEAIGKAPFEQWFELQGNSNLKSFLRTERNISAAAAFELYSIYQNEANVKENKRRLKAYFEDCCLESPERIQRTIGAFRGDCSEIRKQNIGECLVQLFEKMLQQAIQGKQKQSSPKQEYQISKVDGRKIKDLAVRILRSMDMINEAAIRLLQHQDKNDADCDKYQAAFEAEVETFRLLVIELDLFADKYPKLEVIPELCKMADAIDFRVHYRVGDDGLSIVAAPSIESFRKSLKLLISLMQT